MKIFLRDLLKLPKLILGLSLIALGLIFSRKSNLGMDAWGVFHQGLSESTNLSFGVIVQLVGFIVLILSLIFKIAKPGIGTILNMYLIGALYDIIDNYMPYIPTSPVIRVIFLITGIILLAFGRALYISCSLGQGPRDGLFVGFHLLFDVEIKYVKPAIEFTVLIIGVILGGTFGAGTIISALVSGYCVGLFLALLKYSPKNKEQHTLLTYFY